MIEFSCVYCGQPVRVGDDLALKQIGCPGCGHTIRVRPDKPGELSRPSDPTAEAARQAAAERWSRMSDEEIREVVLVPALPGLKGGGGFSNACSLRGCLAMTT